MYFLSKFNKKIKNILERYKIYPSSNKFLIIAISLENFNLIY